MMRLGRCKMDGVDGRQYRVGGAFPSARLACGLPVNKQLEKALVMGL